MNKNFPQRKTTLKWKTNGDLSEIDMLRILERISLSNLSECELTCDLEEK